MADFYVPRFVWKFQRFWRISLKTRLTHRINSSCNLCDDSNNKTSYPIENAVSGNHSWWQSPTLALGKQFEYVTINIDLGQVSVDNNNFQCHHHKLELFAEECSGNVVSNSKQFFIVDKHKSSLSHSPTKNVTIGTWD